MFKKLIAFISEAKLELKKVAWTPANELWSVTRVVILSMIMLTIYIVIISGVLKFIINSLEKLVS